MVRAVRRAAFAGAIYVMACAAQVSAQQGQKSAEPPAAKSMTDGVVAGQFAASASGSGGSFWGGFAGGLFLGLIGTGIAYVAQSPADIPVMHMAESQKQGSEYTLGFK